MVMITFGLFQGLNLVDCQSCSHSENLIKRIVRAKTASLPSFQPARHLASHLASVLLRPSIHNGFNSLCAVLYGVVTIMKFHCDEIQTFKKIGL